MRASVSLLTLAAALASASLPVAAHDASVMVGGQSMLPAKDIVESAKQSADRTTLVTAVQAA
ncbi:hypothetical protein [Zemynaea arenosa]|uniref:hypothetical protein n=1 Tax=Zemynaea arenosa TaxID=2561931 RepID=UPI001E4E5A30|nr:hypothetical protein [Massilia arenosa]